MKKLVTLLSIIIFSFGLQAQYLNVTDIYFANAPNDVPLPDTGLIAGASVVLHFKFTNNLSGQQDINPGDKISFGWHTVGSSVVDTLGTMSWPALLPNGQSATLYAHHNTTLPSDPCFSWEVCMWPVHNPYAPNTDPTKGRHCTLFKTTGCTGLSSAELASHINGNNFYVANQSVHYQFPEGSKNNRIELYDLAGKRVLSENVSDQGLINMYGDKISGVYVLRAINSESEITKKVYIK
ncbi:T9SS type A sorting domain-containing protein [Owenweeksia hongkongensis]|uniref:T9SS type A sorting domain-containing protein n=1 Tax=Owenweeksia hongkongensis TaxID=253245 RepID=UPI003A8DAF8D